MSDTLSEAERLLNTIVSSRVRLASLRGDAHAAPEPATEGTAELQSTARVSSREQPDPMYDARQTVINAPEPMYGSIEELDVAEAEADEAQSSEPLILGLPDPNPTFDDDLSNEDDARRDAENLATDLPDERTFFDADIADPEAFETDEPDKASDEIDPFSFLDLIPDAEASIVETDATLDVPPPVRPKPVMPLPAAVAIGAPSAPPEAEPIGSEPSDSSAPMPEDELTVIEPQSNYGLTQPRSVQPQIMDPERERLDVEVFSTPEPTEEWQDPQPLASTPRLTEPSSNPTASPTIAKENTEEAVFDAISNAQEALRRGALQEANLLLSDALDWNPHHIEARLMRGRCLRDSGDQVGALSDFLISLEHAPHSPLPHLELGNLSFSRKDYSRAIQHYTDAIDRDPSHAMALCKRGICHHYRRRPESALDDLRMAARIDSEIANIDRYISMVANRQPR